MRNCDRDGERERGIEKLRQCLRLRCCQTAVRLDSSELFNIYAETWLILILCSLYPQPHFSILPFPLSSPPHLTWLAKHFLHWAFPSEFALVCAAYLKQFCDVNCGSAAQLLFLALAFCRWLLRPFWGCLCFAWLLRVEVGCAQKCPQCVCVMCVYVYLMRMCVCVCVCVLGVSIVAA